MYIGILVIGVCSKCHFDQREKSFFSSAMKKEPSPLARDDPAKTPGSLDSILRVQFVNKTALIEFLHEAVVHQFFDFDLFDGRIA